MDSLADLLEPDSDRTAIEQPARSSHPISLGQFSKTAFKTGNYLRHLGVGPGVTVAIADDLAPEPLYALFGAALLGATVRFEPAGDDWRVLVGRTADVVDQPTQASSKRIAYGDQPDDPAISHFGTDIWSENPAFPDCGVKRDIVAIESDGQSHTHGELLDAAQSVVERADLTAEDVVAVRSPLSRSGTVIAGVLAPLVAGATILLPDGETTGTIAVGQDDASESRIVRPADVV